MSEEPKDPLAFDFGIGFESAATRIRGEKAQRDQFKARELGYHHAFLDDLLRSIMPNDLILLGAETGAGKTEIARIIGVGNAMAGKNVFYFALEAEEKELERRTKFAILCELVAERGGRGLHDLNYPDWYRGRCDDIVAGLNGEAEDIVAKRLATFHTYYRGSKFDHQDIKRLFLSIQTQADLIILDHLHYVDIEDENENRGFKKTVKMIRDVSLGMGRPVILIAHIRKRDSRSKAIVPELEMFHGSSDVIKICTSAIMLAPARSCPNPKPGISNTFIHVPKDRTGGATGLVALCEFDRRHKTYADNYTIGRQSFSGDGFEPMGDKEKPRWAKRHVGMAVPMTTSL